MKKLIYLAGLIAPGIAVKALAQEMKLPDLLSPERQQQMADYLTNLNRKESAVVDLYSTCTKAERSVYLWKVFMTSSEMDRSQVNQMILQRRIEDILSLPEEQQVATLVQQIRNGGVRWGSIGEPTDI